MNEQLPTNEADLRPTRTDIEIETPWVLIVLKQLYAEIMELQQGMLGAAATQIDESLHAQIVGIREDKGNFYLVLKVGDEG